MCAPNRILETKMQPMARAEVVSGAGVQGQVPLQTGPLAIVGGCGHVGLPLGLAFARQGLQVDLVDTSAERVAMVNGGRMPFHEDDAEAVLQEVTRAGLL